MSDHVSMSFCFPPIIVALAARDRLTVSFSCRISVTASHMNRTDTHDASVSTAALAIAYVTN